MRVGIAADHGGFALKQELAGRLRAAGHAVVDFGAVRLDPDDDYPDFVAPLARAVAAGQVERGIAICGSSVGACVCANKIAGVRAALIEDHFSARQGVEDDHLNVLCLGGRTEGAAVAWDLVETFFAARYSQAERHLRRLAKVAALVAAQQEKDEPNWMQLGRLSAGRRNQPTGALEGQGPERGIERTRSRGRSARRRPCEIGEAVSGRA